MQNTKSNTIFLSNIMIMLNTLFFMLPVIMRNGISQGDPCSFLSKVECEAAQRLDNVKNMLLLGTPIITIALGLVFILVSYLIVKNNTNVDTIGKKLKVVAFAHMSIGVVMLASWGLFGENIPDSGLWAAYMLAGYLPAAVLIIKNNLKAQARILLVLLMLMLFGISIATIF